MQDWTRAGNSPSADHPNQRTTAVIYVIDIAINTINMYARYMFYCLTDILIGASMMS
jgi:hypothetical protein